MSKPYRTYPGVSPDIQINKLKHLPKDRLLLALTRLRDSIAAGRPLASNDEPDCSWGLCHESKETWPDPQDHTFPIDFEVRGRITPLDPRKPNECPLDRRNGAKPGMNGCLYSCLVLNPKKGDLKLDRTLALARYDAAIDRMKGEAP